jgi:chromosome segregation protein
VPARAFVTQRGEVLGEGGLLTGGRGDRVGAHLIAVKREIRDLHGVVARLESELSAALSRHGELRTGIASRQAALEAARSEAHDTEIAIVKTEKDLRRSEEELARTRQRIAQVAREREELARSLDTSQGEGADAMRELEAATQARHEAAQACESCAALWEEQRKLLDLQNARVSDARVRVAQARQRAESDRQALARLDASVKELEQREQRLRNERDRAAQQQGETAAAMVLAREQLAEQRVSARAAHARLAEARARYEAARHALGAREVDLREIRARVEEGTHRVSSLTMEDRQLAMEIAHLVEQVRDRHRIDLRKVIGDYHDRVLHDESVRARIEELHRLVERMGEVNPTAIEEYEEQNKRYEFLTAQKVDLEQALEQLEKAIREMNRASKRLFREAFDAINERFKVIFPRLFGGGRGELVLTNPEDLLETGVDIIAQPPGKKLGSIDLMSGGEKALTAVSLIFAIFQYKPSPFCLLDEVDAPLDEANIGRYCEAIRAMARHSQFILITHNKQTMQMADVLYGVTMETPGISKIVSVELRPAAQKRADTPGAAPAVA